MQPPFILNINNFKKYSQSFIKLVRRLIMSALDGKEVNVFMFIRKYSVYGNEIFALSSKMLDLEEYI